MEEILWRLKGVCMTLEASQTSDLFDEKAQNLFWMLGQELERAIDEIEKLNNQNLQTL